MSTSDPPIIVTGGSPQGTSNSLTSTASSPDTLSTSSPDGSGASSLDESSATSADALSASSPDEWSTTSAPAPIAASGGSTNVKLGLNAFPGLRQREFDDTTAPIVRVVVKDGNGVELQSFEFPDGRFKVEFHGPKTER